MIECHDDAMRESLPLLARGRLDGPATVALRAHLAACAACADELALLERSARLFDAATPRLDLDAIVRAMPAAARPALTVHRGAARARPRLPRYVLAAAASLVLVATLSLAALNGRFFDPTAATNVGPDSAAPAATPSTVALVAGTELADLGEEDLEQLLSELDRLEATIAAEPISMQRAVVSAPEVM
jgi:anti-sigma factor RsiW